MDEVAYLRDGVAQHPQARHPAYVRRARPHLRGGALRRRRARRRPVGRQPARRTAPAAPSRVTLVLQWKPQAQFAGYYMALEQGLLPRARPGRRDRPRRPRRRLARATCGAARPTSPPRSSAARSRGRRQGAALVDVCQVVNRSNLMLVAHRDTVKDRDDLDGARVSLWGTSFRAAYLGFFETRRRQAADPAAVLLREPVPAGRRRRLRGHGVQRVRHHRAVRASTPASSPRSPCATTGSASPRTASTRWPPRNARRAPAVPGVRRRDAGGLGVLPRPPRRGGGRASWGTPRDAHVPTNRVHQRWMLDHILTAIYPGGTDAWRAGRALARRTTSARSAVMIGEGLIGSAPSYERFVAEGARSAP